MNCNINYLIRVTKMNKLILIALIGAANCAETLIWEDDFEKLDFKKWQHEITLSGGGNWEFEQYRNNRTNSFVKDGVLHLQPTLTSEAIGETVMKTGDYAIWGGDPSSYCTSNAFWGCERNAGRAMSLGLAATATCPRPHVQH